MQRIADKLEISEESNSQKSIGSSEGRFVFSNHNTILTFVHPKFVF